jgi:hypothetical protein
MHRWTRDLLTRVRLALALTLAGAAGLLLPTLLAGAEAPSVVVIASLAAAVASLVYVAQRRELAPAFVAVRVHADEASSRTRPGRVTDPVHHPIRRRAPGQV